PAARISRNGWSSAGRARPKSPSHASLPMPRTHESPGSADRNPTARTSEAKSPHRERTRIRESSPGRIFATIKSAARVNGALTGCGKGSTAMTFPTGPDDQVHDPTRRDSTERLRKGDVVVDFLHVIAIIEHGQEFLERRQVFPVEWFYFQRK